MQNSINPGNSSLPCAYILHHLKGDFLETINLTFYHEESTWSWLVQNLVCSKILEAERHVTKTVNCIWLWKAPKIYTYLRRLSGDLTLKFTLAKFHQIHKIYRQNRIVQLRFLLLRNKVKTYVKCYLLPDRYHGSKMRSEIIKETINPK